VPSADRDAFLAHAATAMDTLAGQPGCRGIALGQATDDAELLLLTSEWDSVGAYRRGLSSFDVKMHAIPLLSTGIDEPSAFEIIRAVDADGLRTAASGLAADAGQIGLGSAASPDVPSVST
jgi:quinol monooxygenase YgiN